MSMFLAFKKNKISDYIHHASMLKCFVHTSTINPLNFKPALQFFRRRQFNNICGSCCCRVHIIQDKYYFIYRVLYEYQLYWMKYTYYHIRFNPSLNQDLFYKIVLQNRMWCKKKTLLIQLKINWTVQQSTNHWRNAVCSNTIFQIITL